MLLNDCCSPKTQDRWGGCAGAESGSVHESHPIDAKLLCLRRFDLAQYRIASCVLKIRRQPTVLAAPRSHVVTGEGKMTEFIEVLQQEHRNIESLLRVLERELSVFDRGERPDY